MNFDKYKGKFLPGFLVGLAGYVVNNILFSIMSFLIRLIKSGIIHKTEFWNDIISNINNLFSASLFILVFSLIIWIPVSVITGLISKFIGFRASLWTTIAVIVIILMVTGTCTGVVM